MNDDDCIDGDELLSCSATSWRRNLIVIAAAVSLLQCI